MSSRLAHPEVRAALAAAARDHRITGPGLRRAEHDWAAFWSAVRPVELTPAVEQSAGRLAGDHGLRGADAVHLASALAVGPGDLVVAAWDRRLRAGVLGAGLALAPV